MSEPTYEARLRLVFGSRLGCHTGVDLDLKEKVKMHISSRSKSSMVWELPPGSGKWAWFGSGPGEKFGWSEKGWIQILNKKFIS